MKDILLISCPRFSYEMQFMRFPFKQILSSKFLWNTGFLKKKSWIPMGVTYLASYLEENGFTADILDLDTSIPSRYEKTVLEKVKDYRYIGISFITMFYDLAVRLAVEIKKNNPGIQVVLGGPHASFDYENILNNVPEVDFIIVGEGERALASLLKNTDEKSGIAYRSGRDIKVSETAEIEDLDSIPFPARDKCKPIDYDYFDETPVLTSRGCTRRCSFCVEHRMFPRKRFRSAANVADEIEQLVSAGKREILIYDSDFAVSKQHVKKIAAELNSRSLSFDKFYCLGHVESINTDFLDTLLTINSGEFIIEIGVESLCAALYGVNKTADIISYKEKLTEILEYGTKRNIRFTLNYLMPLPGQTLPEVLKEMEFLKKYGYIHMFLLTPYPGTLLWKEAGASLITRELAKYNCKNLVYNPTSLKTKEIRKCYRYAVGMKRDIYYLYILMFLFYKKIRGYH